MSSELVAVASRSFSQDRFLRSELEKKYSKIRFNDTGKSLTGSELIQFLSGAQKAIIALEPMKQEILQQLPDLKLISKYGVGLDNIDFNTLKQLGVKLSWKGGVNKRSVAELALHFILGTVRGSFHSHHEVQKHKWVQFKGQNLTGKTVGIVGLGHVGQELASLLGPFNLKILAYDLYEKKDFCLQYNIKQTGLEELLKNSDVVTIHLPLTSKTKNLFTKEKLQLMKRGSFLVNTARGGLVDELDLYDMLFDQHIQSAAFDVFEVEPPLNSKLMSLDNFYSTAHIGGSSLQSIHLMGLAAIDGLSEGKEALPANFFDYPL